MAKFKLEITLGNDAMRDPEEVIEALVHVAGTLNGGSALDVGESWPIRDANGNTVGSWKVTR